MSGSNFFVLCVCVQLLIAAGCIQNDIRDADIDKVNKPKTHIIGRTISMPQAKLLFAFATMLIILLSFYISYYMFKEWAPISAGVYLLSILYNVYLKRSPLFGNILMAALAAGIPLVIFLFAKECIYVLNNEKIRVLIWLYALFPFLIIIPRELSLDISDIEGDRAGGCYTLPIVIGEKKSKTVVVVVLLFVILASLLVMYKYPYLKATFAVVDLLILYYLYKFRKTEKRIDYIRIGRFLWFIMIIGLIGFAIASIY